MAQIGDKIRIVEMKDEPQYQGKEGVITYIGKDPWGDVFYCGTWGGCNIYPSVDRIEIIK